MSAWGGGTTFPLFTPGGGRRGEQVLFSTEADFDVQLEALAGKLKATLLLSRKAQSMIAAELGSPVRQRLPLSAAQEGLESYVADMSAGKILFVTNSEDFGVG